MSCDRAHLVITPSETPPWQERGLEPPCSRWWGTNTENRPEKLPGTGRRNHFKLVKCQRVVTVIGLSSEATDWGRMQGKCSTRDFPSSSALSLFYNTISLCTIWKRPLEKKSCWPWKRACFTSPQGTSPSAAVWRSNTNEGFAVTLVAVVSKQILNLGAAISTKIIYVRSKISETAQMRLLRTSRLFQKHLPQMCVSCWALIREKHPVTCISISFKGNWNLTKGCVGARESGLTCLTPGRRVLFGVNCPALTLECSTFFPLCNDNY